jgi:hypothetical protein
MSSGKLTKNNNILNEVKVFLNKFVKNKNILHLNNLNTYYEFKRTFINLFQELSLEY